MKLTHQDVSVLAETTTRMGFDDLFDCGSRVKSFGWHGRPLGRELAGSVWVYYVVSRYVMEDLKPRSLEC